MAGGETIALSNIIDGTLKYLRTSGAPTAGTSEVQTLTIGGTPTGGTFKLAFEGFLSSAITWSATNATLIASIDAALEALPNIGVNNLTTAAGTLTAGIGTITLTFANEMAKKAVKTVSAADNSLTGTAPTLAVVETTPGVNATGRGAITGSHCTDTTNGVEYINTGTPLNPTWVTVGSQT